MKVEIGLLVAMGFVGCSSPNVTHYVADSSGHLHRVGNFTPAEAFKYYVVREVGFEVAGSRPPHHCRTWREYWTKVDSYWFGAEQFGTHEAVLAYIEAQRRAHGLPSM